MELNDGNIDIIRCISYMLASALRQGDAENFLNIYDTLIPEGFSNKQVKLLCKSPVNRTGA